MIVSTCAPLFVLFVQQVRVVQSCYPSRDLENRKGLLTCSSLPSSFALGEGRTNKPDEEKSNREKKWEAGRKKYADFFAGKVRTVMFRAFLCFASGMVSVSLMMPVVPMRVT